MTITLFQDVPVLAIGGEMLGRPAPAEGQPQPADHVVTLALGPQETSLLLFARDHGRIQLSLRRLQDSGQVPVSPASLETLMQRVLGVAPQAPAPPPPNVPTREVEVYKGLKRDVVVLPDREE